MSETLTITDDQPTNLVFEQTTKKQEIDASVTDKVEFGETITPIEVYRDGPRFYCAYVTDGEKEFQIKDVKHNPEANNDPNNLHSPKNHLIIEIEMVRFLNSQATYGINIAPTLYQSNIDNEPWYSSEHLKAGWLGMHQSPFFYNLENLAKVSPHSVFVSIAELQASTSKSDVPSWIIQENRTQTNNPDLSNGQISYLSERSGVSQEKVADAYVKALEIRRQLPRVLIHGEIYPQHIFVEPGATEAKFIDWENAKLGNQYSDHVAVWLRAFENPSWQNEYYNLVSSQPDFDEDGWNANVFLAAFGNYQYLSEWDQMDQPRRDQAAQYCKEVALQAIESLTAAQSSPIY